MMDVVLPGRTLEMTRSCEVFVDPLAQKLCRLTNEQLELQDIQSHYVLDDQSCRYLHKGRSVQESFVHVYQGEVATTGTDGQHRKMSNHSVCE